MNELSQITIKLPTKNIYPDCIRWYLVTRLDAKSSQMSSHNELYRMDSGKIWQLETMQKRHKCDIFHIEITRWLYKMVTARRQEKAMKRPKWFHVHVTVASHLCQLTSGLRTQRHNVMSLWSHCCVAIFYWS